MGEKIDIVDCFQGVFKNKKVLITGHTGFKGAWLSLWLSELGAVVGGLSQSEPSNPSLYRVLNLNDRVKTYKGDIGNIEFVRKAFNDFKPDIVFHLAAQALLRKSYDEPKATFDINVGGTINILECIKNVSGIKAAVIVTSDKCYKNSNKKEGYVETDPLGGSDPYSASKACAEIVTACYCESFFQKENMPKVCSARAGNVIGGGDWAQDRIIPDCVRAWLKHEDVILRKPEATRPWQHVLEALSGYLWLSACLCENNKLNGEAFNFGPNVAGIGSVGELTGIFQRNLGKVGWKHIPHEKEKKETDFLNLKCDKAFEFLSWKPVLNFEETVKVTAQWYKAYYDSPDKITDFSIYQIKQFVDKARQNDIAWAANKSTSKIKH